MRKTKIEAGLSQFKTVFQRILEDDASQVIDEAILELDSSKKEYDEKKRRTDNPKLVPKPWGYTVYPQKPLRFRTSEVIKGFPMSIDIYCVIRWEKEGEMPVNQQIHLRVWSKELDYVIRPEWDADQIIERISSQYGRVMLRCHFDLANPKQEGPKYHLQFGGEAQSDEVWWLPGIVDLPRINFPPMDLILIGQLIAANFYKEEYERIRNEIEWIGTVRESQKIFLKDYYQLCLTEINSDNILLDRLWNSWQKY